MSIKKKATRLAALITVAGLALTACGSGGSSNDAAGPAGTIPVKVGLIGPKTGTAPEYWTELQRAFTLAQKDLEGQYQIKFSTVEADDKGSPEVASQEISKLLNQQNVNVIIGPPQSGPAQQVAELVQRTGRPWLVSVAAADEIINPKADPNWAFRTNNSNNSAITVSGDYLFKDSATAGIVYAADGYGQSNLAALKAYAQAHGLSLKKEEAVQPGAADMTATIRRMKDAGVNSLFIAMTSGADIATLAKAIEQVEYKPVRTLATATILSGFRELATPAQWKQIVFIEPRDLVNGSVAEVSAKYKAAYGKDPIFATVIYSTYSAVKLYAQAVKQVGKATDYTAVRKAIENTPSLAVFGRTWDKPFSAADHELYTADPKEWFVHGFDPQGKLIVIGKAAE